MNQERREFLKKAYRIGGMAALYSLGVVEEAISWGVLPAVVSKTVSWAAWDESSESGLASNDTFVCLMENKVSGGNETGQGGGLSGVDLVLTQAGNVAGASGSPPKRIFDNVDDNMTWTTTAMQNWFSGTTFTLIEKVDTYADVTETKPNIWANGVEYCYVSVEAGSGLTIFYKDGTTTSNGAVITANNVPTTGTVYFYLWADGIDVRWGFSTTKADKLSDIAAGDRALLNIALNFTPANIAGTGYAVSAGAERTNMNVHYIIASKLNLIDNSS